VELRLQLFNPTNATLLVYTYILKESVREDLKVSREDISVKRILVDGICDPHRIDYFECLHGFKENHRIKTVMDEMKRQEYEARYATAPEKQH
jgi:hypothetical protein